MTKLNAERQFISRWNWHIQMQFVKKYKEMRRMKTDSSPFPRYSHRPAVHGDIFHSSVTLFAAVEHKICTKSFFFFCMNENNLRIGNSMPSAKRFFALRVGSLRTLNRIPLVWLNSWNDSVTHILHLIKILNIAWSFASLLILSIPFEIPKLVIAKRERKKMWINQDLLKFLIGALRLSRNSISF